MTRQPSHNEFESNNSIQNEDEHINYVYKEITNDDNSPCFNQLLFQLEHDQNSAANNNQLPFQTTNAELLMQEIQQNKY